MSSDIQVSVKWKDETIFSGETVDCIITFRNAAPVDANDGLEAATPRNGHTQGQPSQASNHQRRGSRPMNGVVSGGKYAPPSRSPLPFLGGGGRRHSANARHKSNSISGNRAASAHHRASSSVSTTIPMAGQANSFSPATSTGKPGQYSAHRHQKSLSIISIDRDGELKSAQPPPSAISAFPRPARAHARSTSFQVSSNNRKSEFDDGTPPIAFHHPRYSSPNTTSNTPGVSPGLPNPPSESTTPKVRSNIPTHSLDFKFPQSPLPPVDTQTNGLLQPSITHEEETGTISPLRTPDPRQKNYPSDSGVRLAPATKIMSNSSANGSTRSSAEFYSMSNNSAETLESEYTMYSSRPVPPKHRRYMSSMEATAPRLRQPDKSQSLLMGYAQISASFTVDGSLIDQLQFEKVKRKGFVGAQSPGTAAKPKAEKTKGSFWGNLGLNNLSEQLSSLLSGGELDGLREMRGVTSSQCVPLLSTPQSLLFVDMRLNPGEERSFSFSFTLPPGLPASHRGRAIKIAYNLVIGTQRPSVTNQAQRVNRVNLPFRVSSGVDGKSSACYVLKLLMFSFFSAEGNILGHDLMKPYLLLHDTARVSDIHGPPQWKQRKRISTKTWTSAPEFLDFVDELLRQGSRSPRGSFVSGTGAESMDGSIDNKLSCKDAIDFAILRSNQSAGTERSANRFEISRNGHRIAVVVLNRPFHRLGETVVASIDFTGAAMPTYSLHGTLEAVERVNPELALRSAASITRATRRVVASSFENTLFASRVTFSPAIPVSASPTIVTSGVGLEWQLRFEFVTSSVYEGGGEDGGPLIARPGPMGHELLETVETDERGSVFTALESLPCESFEVAIPLRVYGGVVIEPGSEETLAVSI